MSTNKYRIKTKELTIEPPEDGSLWEGDWTLIRKKDRYTEPVCIGKASFRGDKELGTVPITVELDEEFRNKKYGTEVFKLMSDFALGFKNIYEVSAQTQDDNYKCVAALEKAGFVFRNRDGHTETYSITKPGTSWLGLYLLIGLAVGLVLGFVFGNSIVGLIIGLAAGILTGASMDQAASKEREKVTGKSASDRKRKAQNKAAE